MKKYLLLLLLLIPINIYAIDINIDDYNKKDLNEILVDVNVQTDLDTKEDMNSNTIYFLYGNDCNFSKEFMKFYVDNILPTYKNVHIVGFETWNDPNNQSLFKSITKYKNSSFDGSPYIIIGSRIFEGYTSSYNNQIISAIKNYDNKDIFEEMKNYEKNDFSNTVKLLIILSLFILLFVVALKFINKKNNY